MLPAVVPRNRQLIANVIFVVGVGTVDWFLSDKYLFEVVVGHYRNHLMLTDEQAGQRLKQRQASVRDGLQSGWFFADVNTLEGFVAEEPGDSVEVLKISEGRKRRIIGGHCR